MTTPVTAQGSAIQGMSTQQGYTPSFPAPLGIEQYLGQPQQYGGFPQQSYTQSQFPGQQQPQVQQIAQSLLTQLLPIAHQVILPQVLTTAMQQIPMHLQQLVAQVAQQVSWQQPQFGQQGSWQQPQFGQQVGWQQPQFGQQGGWQQPQFGQQGSWQQQPQLFQQGQAPFGRGF